MKGGKGEKGNKEVNEKGTQVRQEAKGRRREVGDRKEGTNGRGGKKQSPFQFQSI